MLQAAGTVVTEMKTPDRPPALAEVRDSTPAAAAIKSRSSSTSPKASRLGSSSASQPDPTRPTLYAYPGSTALTADTYAHVMPEAKAHALGVVGDALSG